MKPRILKRGTLSVVACLDCGTPYAGLGCDLVLPDQQWGAIFPEGQGVLCANCICKRAKLARGTTLLAWIDNIDYEQARTRKGD